MTQDIKIIISEYNKGLSIKQLAFKYKMSEQELSEAIQKELFSEKTKTIYPKKTLKLADGTEISAYLIKTVNQPKGGTVSSYITDDGKKYYQYLDANGKQTKITNSWDGFQAAMDNIEVAWQKFQNKEYWSAIVTLLEGAEDPCGSVYGEAPAVGFAKGTNLIKSIKNSWQYIKQLKKAKTFQQFKQVITNILRKIGIREKLKPDSFNDKTIKRPAKIYTVQTEEGRKISQAYKQSGVLYYDKKIPNGFRDGGHGAIIDSNGKVINSTREIITVDRELDHYLTKAINYAKNATKDMNEEQKVKFIYQMVLDISGNAAKGTKKSDILAKEFQNQEVLLGDVFAKGAACCRHKALMFKILAEEVGLKAKMIRGVSADAFGEGGHVWNEIKLSNGKKLVIDTQNSHLIDLDAPTKADKAVLKKYYYHQEHVY